MCGIFGQFYFDSARPVNPHVVERACAVMAYRGPDGQGILCERNVGLGHCRLAIIDLGGGAQPMGTAGGRYWVTYNGEIYNFRELRKQLVALGYSFKSESDTEVLLHSYAEWGPQCVERFNGMFAFGLWDRDVGSLFLARDRLGIKPLYYCVTAHGITFASEVTALLQNPEVPRRINAQAISDYLSLGYILAPKTIYQGVQKLPQGHVLVCKEGRVRISSYWDLASRIVHGAEGNKVTTEEHLKEQLYEKLRRAVSAQMVSDVPVGAFLSGGVDSSAVVGFMVGENRKPVNTFSIGFEEPSYSELSFAQEVASFLHTMHHEQIVRPELENLLPFLARRLGEPFGDTSFLPTYLLSELARRSVKVVLSGDGGDETFAGYETYLADRLHPIYQRVPKPIRQWVIEPVVRALPVTRRKVSFDYKVKQFIAAGDLTPELAHYSWRELFSEHEKGELLDPDFVDQSSDYRPSQVFEEYFRQVDGADPVAQAQYVDVKTWLADNILVKVDRASMFHGVETRVPLLDHEIVEFGLSLPSHLKLRGWQKKYLFKETVAPLLPKRIVHRKKSGFNSPVGPWLGGPLKTLYENIFACQNELIPLNRSKIQSLLGEHLEGRRDHGYRLWAVLMLQLWAQGQEI